MLIRSSNQFRRYGITCSLALIIASSIVLAGEKIQFSDQPEKTASPSKRTKDLSRPFDLKQSAPGGSEVAPLPPLPPTKARDPKIEERIDQKKNWIFSTPSKIDSESALKEMFNVREYKFDELGGEKRPKSQIDRYFEEKAEARKEISSKLNSRGKDGDPKPTEDESIERGSIAGLPLEQGTRSSTSPGSDLDPNAWGKKGSELGSAISASPGDISPRNFNSADVLGLPRRVFGSGSGEFFGQEQRQQRLLEFQKTLGASSVRSELLRDPINLQADGTRQAINPIVGTVSSGLANSLETGLTRAGGFPAVGGPSAISDLINSRPMGGSSLSPAVTVPASPAFLQRSPAVLEIPRRKF